jgi:hypothetical protein
MRSLPLLTLAALLFAGSLAGCTRALVKPRLAYEGPTDPMVDVVAAINRNNAAVPTMWASVGYKATVVDDKKRPHTANGDGVLMYRAPRDMRLVGYMTGAGTIFELGSTADRYWLVLKPEMETMWWGRHRNVGKPCVSQDIPIRPDLVMEVLGVATINTNFNEVPAPTMRFDNERDVYAFVWNGKLPDRWAALKEVWFDRATKLPIRVLLYDVNGRVTLRAELAGHKPVEVPGRQRGEWPKVASQYNLYFPDSGTVMEFHLGDVMLDKRGTPTRKGIDFPDPRKAGVRDVIQVDAACEGE